MLELKDLSIKYKSTNKEVFSGVSFKVEKGEVIAILGPSGCGKTTTLNLIASLLNENEIKIEGEIKKDNNFESRMVFQEPTLLPWRTVEKNIAFGLESENFSKNEIQERVKNAIKLVGLEEYEKYYPSKLSVGMQQRVNFARALVCEPDLLLLDEPFSALDINRKKKIQKDFLRIIKEKNLTAIFVTHSIEEALEIGDKLYVFFDGKKIKKGFYENKFKDAEKSKLYLKMTDYFKKI